MFNLQKLCQSASKKHENCSCFTSFVFKSLNFAQILEIFAQTCVCTSAAVRSSEWMLTRGASAMKGPTPSSCLLYIVLHQ